MPRYLLLSLLFFSSLAHAVVVKVPSTTWKDRNFVFLTRFVFKPNVNSAEIIFRHVAKTDEWGRVVSPTSAMSPKLTVNIFSSLKEVWDRISFQTNAHTCTFKETSSLYSKQVQTIQGTLDYAKQTLTQELVVTPSVKISHWWYIFLSNCDQTGVGIDDVYIELRNGRDDREAHISFDEYSMHDQAGAYLFFYLCFALTFSYFAWLCKEQQKQYKIHRVLTAAASFSVISMIFEVAFYNHFMETGEAIRGFRSFAFHLKAFSSLMIMYVILRISKGWGISTNHVEGFSHDLVLVVFNWFTYLFAQLSADANRDAVGSMSIEPVYLYETVPGFVLLFTRIFTAFWVLLLFKQILLSGESEKAKLRFYAAFGFFSMMWFFSLPFVVFMVHFYDNSTRAKFAFATENIVNLFCFSIIAIIFRAGGIAFCKCCDHMACLPAYSLTLGVNEVRHNRLSSGLTVMDGSLIMGINEDGEDETAPVVFTSLKDVALHHSVSNDVISADDLRSPRPARTQTKPGADTCWLPPPRMPAAVRRASEGKSDNQVGREAADQTQLEQKNTKKLAAIKAQLPKMRE